MFPSKETDYCFNDAKAGMGFHYDCGRKNEKFFDSRHRSATDIYGRFVMVSELTRVCITLLNKK